MVCLGIDVKLKKSRSLRDRDGYGWSSHLHSPFIYLNLGNWSVDTWEEPLVDIRNWITNYTLPKLTTTGKIPKMYELRQYLLGRIERSISGYIELIKDPNEEIAEINIPKNYQELNILEEKLFLMHQLFSDLNNKYYPQNN